METDFQSLVRSPYLNINCHERLRGMLVLLIQDEIVKPNNRMEELYNASAPDDDLRVWLQKLKKLQSWALDIAARFIFLFFEINICIVTNATKFWVWIRERVCIRKVGITFQKKHQLYSCIIIYSVVH